MIIVLIVIIVISIEMTSLCLNLFSIHCKDFELPTMYFSSANMLFVAMYLS